MKKPYFFLIVALLAFSCKKDDPELPGQDCETLLSSQVILTFDTRFGGETLVLGEVHENGQGHPFSTTEVKFYVSNINLHRSNGDMVELSPVELIDIHENKGTLEYDIPCGEYTGVSYDLGVPAEMNGTQDGDFSTSIYPAGHPLNEQESGMYWQWASGYRFFAFEGRYDTEPNSTQNLPLSYAFHTGIDTLFREVGFFQKDMDVQGGDSFEVAFAIDVDSIFATAADTINLAEVSSFHGAPDQMETGVKLADNMSKAFVLK